MALPLRSKLGDFTTDPRRLALIAACAIPVGAVAGLLAKVLLMLIGLITHIVYFGTFSTALVQPDPRHWGPVSILIPVVGGLLVGLIARYGSDKIRGHGIPEAIQSILERDSVIQARVALFKPLASALAIGTGGPFGAEGPIIMTGGAMGSLFGQFLHLSSLERRTLLVAGAAGGMSATFGAPIASVLIAVELLLFEWKPRSFIPVVVASFVAYLVRVPLLGTTPPFSIVHIPTIAPSAFGWAVLVGLVGGAVSFAMTKLVYFVEDAYGHLPIHWMWWPAIGGVIVGIGGWFVPQALGVGYPTIDALLNGQLAIAVVAAILAVKIGIWIASLSSGTSGGVLAPLLMIGAATGTLVATIVPGHDAGAWAVVGMAAILGGTMRAPFMATMFAVETTHAWGLMPAVFVACVAATAFTIAFVPRSILTEKLARRGMHVAREYSVHPLELIRIGDVMLARSAISALSGAATVASIAPRFAAFDEALIYGEYPVMDETGSPIGFVTRARILERAQSGSPDETIGSIATRGESIHVDDRVREAANAMAQRNCRSLIVIDEAGAWVGLITSGDMLHAWRRGMEKEAKRRRVRSLRNPSLVRADGAKT